MADVAMAADPTVRVTSDALAAAYLRDLWDEDLYPVDPFQIASQLGVKVWLAVLDAEVSGIFRKRPSEGCEIWINREDNARRQRFTCAHELGHFAYLTAAGRLTVDDGQAIVELRDSLASTGISVSERFANEFAAALLMPEAAVRGLAHRGDDALAMARFFDVSPAAMEIRLKNLGLAPR